MNDLNKYIKKQLKNKEFKEEWEKSEIESIRQILVSLKMVVQIHL